MSFTDNLSALRQAVTHTLGVIDGKLRNKADKSEVLSPAQVDQRIQALIGTAPESLDTLNELAAALNNNPDFAASITQQLGTKANTAAVETLETQLSTALTELTAAFNQGAATIQATPVE